MDGEVAYVGHQIWTKLEILKLLLGNGLATTTTTRNCATRFIAMTKVSVGYSFEPSFPGAGVPEEFC